MRKLGILISAWLVLVAGVLLPATASAAASNSLGVNPRKDYTINAGDKTTDTIFVRNISQKDVLNVSISTLDFQSQGQTGSPEFLLHETQPTRWSLKSYMTLPKSVTIAPGGSSEVPITISIPKGVGAGSYYSAVRFDASGGAGGGNLNLSGSAITLIFVRVPGKTTDNLQLTNFGTYVLADGADSGVYQSFFGATKPQYLSYALKNTGNVAEQPTGSILIKNQFGKQVEVYQNANPNNYLVLLDQTRRIDFCLNPQTKTVKDSAGSSSTVNTCVNPKLAPGRYTANLDLFYGSNGSPSNEIQAKTTFWYLPSWFIFAIIAAILVVAGVVWLVVNTIRNRRSSVYRRR